MTAADRDALLRRMAASGWTHPQIMPAFERAAADVLEAEGLAHLVVQDGREVWRLTDAGRVAAENL